MEASIRKVADYYPEVGHPALSIRRLELTLLVDTPDGTTLIGNFVAKGGTNRVNGIGEAGGEDNQVKLALAAVAEDHLVLSKPLDVARLYLDLAIDDVLVSTGIELEATVTDLT